METLFGKEADRNALLYRQPVTSSGTRVERVLWRVNLQKRPVHSPVLISLITQGSFRACATIPLDGGEGTFVEGWRSVAATRVQISRGEIYSTRLAINRLNICPETTWFSLSTAIICAQRAQLFRNTEFQRDRGMERSKLISKVVIDYSKVAPANVELTIDIRTISLFRWKNSAMEKWLIEWGNRDWTNLLAEFYDRGGLHLANELNYNHPLVPLIGSIPNSIAAEVARMKNDEPSSTPCRIKITIYPLPGRPPIDNYVPPGVLCNTFASPHPPLPDIRWNFGR